MRTPLSAVVAFGLVASCAASTVATQVPAPKAPSQNKPLSVQMADSVMARDPSPLTLDSEKPAWNYTQGLVLKSVLAVYEKTGDARYLDYVKKYYDYFINADGSIRTYDINEYSVDRINAGKVLFPLYAKTKEERYKKAAELLRLQMKGHPRTKEGGFWHKKRYPWQMWLDGLYMASPFLAEYALTFGEPGIVDDLVNQFVWMEAHARDPKTGLLYHGWDESREQKWADPLTGLSKEFWGRAVGWYAMALVDVLDFIPKSHPRRGEIVAILGRLATAIVKVQDPKTSVFWQVLDKKDQAGNYLESSVSVMFAYSFLKAARLGYLDATYARVGRGIYAGVVKEFVTTDEQGVMSIHKGCAVAGLGGDPNSGNWRSGTFDYYVKETVRSNDPKAVGPFILASLEFESSSYPQGAEPADPWSRLPGILAGIKAPVFPDRDFPITNFGARPDGTTDATEAFRKAIAECARAGGGRVVVPQGEFLTGAIHLKSGVNLHVQKGATVRFSTDPAHYLPVVKTRFEGVEVMNYSPLIYAIGQENIAITGEGTLDGQANDTNWWSWKGGATPSPKTQRADRDRLFKQAEDGVPVAERVYGAGHFLRPSFIEPYESRNILIEGVTIRNAPFWIIHPTLSQNVTIRGVTVISHGPNNDGADPESSTDVLIENATFDTGDDCIAIKSGRNADGRRVNKPSQRIVVRNSTMKAGHGGVTIGSEVSGSVRDVFAEKLVMSSPDLERGIRLKTNAVRGGVIENIFVRDVEIGEVGSAVDIDMLYEEGAKGSFTPTIRNVRIERISVKKAAYAFFVRGLPGAPVRGLLVSDSTFRGVGKGTLLLGLEDLVLRNVTIEPADQKRPGSQAGAPLK